MTKKTASKKTASKKIVAIFDLSITADSPAGSCVLELIKHLSDDYRFVVFADRFTNPAPESVSWVRVPLPDRPVIFRYIVFKYLAPVYYKRFLQRSRLTPDLVIGTEGEFADCDVCYVHFCHRAYLQQKLLKMTSLRTLVRFFMHQFNARAEAEAIGQAKNIVVPSQGLAQELSRTYDAALTAESKTKGKTEITTIPNPIDVQRFTRPTDFDAEQLRSQLSFKPEDVVMVFTALGDFERKGMGLILEAIASLQNPKLKLLVVGGNSAEISECTSRAKQLNIADAVRFPGFQADIRPYLWLSNLFILPSAYETFSLATFQAAIAGLPVICTQLYGVEDFLQPGSNGWLVKRTTPSITAALQEAVTHSDHLVKMGEQAHTDASQCSLSRFVERWRTLLRHINDLSSPA